ncbi:hypothetical protein AMAG_08926 [Allomyces macrogynus ATCC 38327]|uniref:Uncharacterized protein n=1 Tax=Allomyces macrogynus (strain ATCC 38327) TaxID=578462 RepID=A0A0L0SMT0_ALLM3|nr:hypothetical protein AMAG_08926 [Allomyces macrogynus ATCC 38327]|eukprot:KNE63861.1 hypothetical protein AMAG_08926 [Allomyces macrogynus ATCC 38327]
MALSDDETPAAASSSAAVPPAAAPLTGPDGEPLLPSDDDDDGGNGMAMQLTLGADGQIRAATPTAIAVPRPRPGGNPAANLQVVDEGAAGWYYNQASRMRGAANRASARWRNDELDGTTWNTTAAASAARGQQEEEEVVGVLGGGAAANAATAGDDDDEGLMALSDDETPAAASSSAAVPPAAAPLTGPDGEPLLPSDDDNDGGNGMAMQLTLGADGEIRAATPTGLSEWGLIHEAIARMLPGKTRVIVRNKYHAELKKNRAKVDQALDQRLVPTLGEYADATGIALQELKKPLDPRGPTT